MSDRHILLSVLFFQEPETPDVWIAQALEHDIAAYGSDLPAARHAFARTLSGYFILAERHQRDPLAGVKPAPDEFWAIWQRLMAQSGPTVAEPVTDLSAFMISAVSHEPLSPAH